MDTPRDIRARVITRIWNELEHRYVGLTRKALEGRVPFIRNLDSRLLRTQLYKLIEQAGVKWPAYVRQWHKDKARIITVAQKSVSDILCNVNHHWKLGDCASCKCQQVYAQLKERGCNIKLPEIDGHIFLTAREYQGPCKEVIHANLGNVPHPTPLDMKRAWMDVKTQIPAVFRDEVTDAAWLLTMRDCQHVTEKFYKGGHLTTVKAYTLRKILQGMVVGPLDKNLGECSIVCPVLYRQALEKLYPVQGEDYEEIHPNKMTPYRKRAKRHTILQEACNTTPNKKANQRGTEHDIKEAWKVYYRSKGWHKLVPFNNQGKLGRPYALFKAKNVTDPVVRASKLLSCLPFRQKDCVGFWPVGYQECTSKLGRPYALFKAKNVTYPVVRASKWMKARPIAPTCSHPMAKILHYAGKALYFAANQMHGEHFIIRDTHNVVDSAQN